LEAIEQASAWAEQAAQGAEAAEEAARNAAREDEGLDLLDLSGLRTRAESTPCVFLADR